MNKDYEEEEEETKRISVPLIPEKIIKSMEKWRIVIFPVQNREIRIILYPF